VGEVSEGSEGRDGIKRVIASQFDLLPKNSQEIIAAAIDTAVSIL
jgi:hypothetical protein